MCKVCFEPHCIIISLSKSVLPHFPDGDTLYLINEWAEKVHEYESEYVGETNVQLAGTGPYGEHRQSPCRYGECGLGNMVTDAFIRHTLKQPTEDTWNDASIAFINAGGMRSTLDVGKIHRFTAMLDPNLLNRNLSLLPL